MKVRCIALLDVQGRPTNHSAWVKIGAVYDVLSVTVEKGDVILRLIGEERGPALFPLGMFEVTNAAIPSTWVVSSKGGDSMSLCPEPWLRRGFWEEFYDREKEAMTCFDQERQKILHDVGEEVEP